MTDLEEVPPLCGLGTFNGPAATTSPYGFAPCVLDKGHQGACDSGTAPEEPPPLAEAA